MPSVRHRSNGSALPNWFLPVAISVVAFVLLQRSQQSQPIYILEEQKPSYPWLPSWGGPWWGGGWGTHGGGHGGHHGGHPPPPPPPP